MSEIKPDHEWCEDKAIWRDPVRGWMIDDGDNIHAFGYLGALVCNEILRLAAENDELRTKTDMSALMRNNKSAWDSVYELRGLLEEVVDLICEFDDGECYAPMGWELESRIRQALEKGELP